MSGKSYQQRLLEVIPGGAHTYSRGYDQFPANAPQILSAGQGVEVIDPAGQHYLDYGMGLRSVNIGYAEPAINQAAIAQIEAGNNLTRPSMIELEAAELLVDLIDSAEMVKFTKNGSTATTAAVKLARAFTNRELVLRCADHPFFSYDDWFISSTVLQRGIPKAASDYTKTFPYNDADALERLLDEYSGQVACVILEPATSEEPADGYLQKVRELCDRHGIVLVFDEMITGFRWHLKGAQHIYGVKPDLSTFGKAMANGFSVAAVAGRREIMELGSIEFSGRERLFLASTTHGAEMCGMGAFVATVKFLQENDVVNHLWQFGRKLVAMLNEEAQAAGVAHSFRAGGIAVSPYYATLDAEGKADMALRTLFAQELIRHRVMMPWISLAYRHDEQSLIVTREAVSAALSVYRRALDEGVEKYLQGDPIKPVFRQFN